MKKHLLLFLLALFTAILPGMALDKTITFSSADAVKETPINVSFAKNNGTTAPAYNSEIRLYYDSSKNGNGGSMTVSCDDGYKLTQIVITYSSSSYSFPTTACGSVGTLSNSGSTGTWKAGNADVTSVEFKNTNTSNSQVRFTKIVVTYEADASDNRPDVTMSFSDTEVNAYLGQSFTAPSLKITPETARSEVKYSSSDNGVATVNTDGSVDIKAAGQTTISAEIKDSENYKNAFASYTLTVIDPNKKSIVIEINKTTLNSTSTAYITTETTLTTSDGTFGINNIIPNTSQARGNNTTIGSNFYIYNTTPIQNIKGIKVYGPTSSTLKNVNSNSKEVSYVYFQVGDSKISSASTTGSTGVLTEEPCIYYESSKIGTYFRIQFANNSTSGTCKVEKIEILLDVNTEDPGKTTPQIEWSSAEVNGTWGNLDAIAWPTLSGAEGLDVTYTSSNTKVATVEKDGKVTVLIPGTTTIKAETAETDEFNSASAEYTLNVALGEEYLTVAEALAFINAGYEGDATVEGYITDITEMSVEGKVTTAYGNATYTISDDVTGTNSLGVYRGYWKNGDKFVTGDEIEVGGKVVVEGKLVNYNGNTPQFTSSSKIVEYTAPEKPEPEPVEYEFDANIPTEMTVGDTYTLVLGDKVPANFEIISGDDDIATVSDEAPYVITAVAPGQVEFTASWDADENFTKGEKDFTITVSAAQGGETPEPAETEWVLVTDLNDLKYGDMIVFSATDKDGNIYAISNAKQDNYRERTETTITDNKIALTDDMMIFEVQATDVENYPYAFLTTNYQGTQGYIGNATGSSYCSVSTLRAGFQAAIDPIENTNTWSITFNNTNDRRLLVYNGQANSVSFRCYSGSTVNGDKNNYRRIQIFKQVTAGEEPPVTEEQVEMPVITLDGEEVIEEQQIEVGKTIVITSATEGATFSGEIEFEETSTLEYENEPMPLEITLTDDMVGLVMVSGWASKDGMKDSEVLNNFTFEVIPAAPAKELDSYMITFGAVDGNQDASAEVSSASLKNFIVTGAEYYAGADDISKVYQGLKGLKFGASSAAGKITINLTEKGQKNVEKIVVNASEWKTADARLVVNNVEQAITSAELADYEFAMTGEKLESITLASTNASDYRLYVKGITVYFEKEDEPEPEVPGELTLSVSDTEMVLAGTTVTASAKGATSYTITTYGIDGIANTETVDGETATFTVDKMNRRFEVVANNEVGPSEPVEAFYTIGKMVENTGTATTYTRVSSLDDLKDGDRIVIAGVSSKDGLYTMSTSRTTNDQRFTGVISSTEKTAPDVLETLGENTMILALESTSGNNYKLRNGEEYIYALSSGSTYSSSDNSTEFTFSVVSNKIKIATSSFNLQMNGQSSPVTFAAYGSSSSGMTAIEVYKETGGATSEMVEDNEYALAVKHTEISKEDASNVNDPKTQVGDNFESSTAMRFVSDEEGTITYAVEIANVSGEFAFDVEGMTLKGHNDEATDFSHDATDDCDGNHASFVVVRPNGSASEIRTMTVADGSYTLINAENENAVPFTTNTNMYHFDETTDQGLKHYANLQFEVAMRPFYGISMTATSNGEVTSVGNIAVDGAEGNVMYFNLQGMRLDSRNLTPGTVVIRRQGNTATKHVVR